MIHIIQDRNYRMITYADLCKQYSTHHNVLSERREKLKNEIRDLIIHFEKNLELNDKTYIKSDPNGQHSLSYVDLMNINDKSSPEIIHPLQAPVKFEKNNPYSIVGISLVLEKGENIHPKTRVYVSLKITLESDYLRIEFVDDVSHPCFMVDTQDGGRFDDVIEEIKASIMRSFSY